MTLFGNGNAVVLNLPQSFDINYARRSAKSIRLATAFAHMTGWNGGDPSDVKFVLQELVKAAT